MKRNKIASILNCLLALLTTVGFPVAATAAGGQLVSNPVNLSSKNYTNPIIFSDYSDPDVTASADGRTFYLTASSFQCTPGLPILKSTDLVNWELVNYALPELPDSRYDRVQHGKGVWAPSIRFHNGEYYIYWGDPDLGIFMTKTSDPEGEWSKPVCVLSGRGIIDTTPLWDEDGRVYLVNAWAASRSGFNSIITVSELSPDGTKIISNPRIVFDGNDGVNHTVEGPKFYKKDGYYWIFAPAGGVVEGWQLAMRSRNVYGPYEPRIVMAQGKTDINGPHQGAWVDTPDGRSWFLHFQDRGAYGRIIHLNPMEWKDGWPVIGADPDGDGCGEPVKTFSRPAPADRSLTLDTHQSPMLYEWHANYAPDNFGYPTYDGMMRIYSQRCDSSYTNLWDVSNLWLQKFPAEKFTMTAKVRISAKQNAEGVASGLVVMGWDYCTFGAVKTADSFTLTMAQCTDAEQKGVEKTSEIATLSPTRTYTAGLIANMELDLWLRLEVTEGAMCRFAYSTDGKKFISAPASFKARAGKWIGAKAGFYSIAPAGMPERGWIDVLDVTITTPDHKR